MSAVFQAPYHLALNGLDKSLKKFGSLSCYLDASPADELRGKIQMLLYGVKKNENGIMEAIIICTWSVFTADITPPSHRLKLSNIARNKAQV